MTKLYRDQMMPVAVTAVVRVTGGEKEKSVKDMLTFSFAYAEPILPAESHSMWRDRNREQKREKVPCPFNALTKLLGHGDELGWSVEVGNVGQGDAPLERGRPEMNCVSCG